MLFHSGDREDATHAAGGEIRIAQESRAIHQHELLGEVDDRARALLTAHHPEVRLVAVQVRGEDHARLVEARGRAEDPP